MRYKYISVHIKDCNNATLDYGTHRVNVYSDKPGRLNKLIELALTPLNYSSMREYKQSRETTLELVLSKLEQKELQQLKELDLIA